VKRYEKYGRNPSLIVKKLENTEKIVKWYGKYGRKESRIVIRYGK
jgi:hypothetical protein